MGGYSGIIGIITLLLTVWAVIAILQSGADNGAKVVWLLVVILLPLIGFIIWFFMGPGSKSLPGSRGPR
jgi:hypothetical protein